MSPQVAPVRPASPSPSVIRRGNLILCPSALANASVIERHFQERGWRVVKVDGNCDLRRLMREEPAAVALVAEEAPGEESGWVTCWKLLNESPEARVIVLGNSHPERGSKRARYVGASAYVPASESPAGVYRAVHAVEASVV